MRARIRQSVVGACCVAVLPFLATAQSGPDWTKLPESPPPSPFIGPPVETFRLRNGVQVFHVARPGTNLVRVEFHIRSGAEVETDGRTGLGWQLGPLLFEGAGTRDRDALQAAIGDAGAVWASLSSRFGFAAALWFVPANLDSAAQLLADIALRPQLPTGAVNASRDRLLQQVAVGQASRGRLAVSALGYVLYPDGHPERRPTLGHAADIAVRGPEELRAIHRALLRPENLALVVVGDITAASVLPALEAAFGGTDWLSDASTFARPIPPLAEPRTRRVVLVDVPGTAQSDIRIFAPTPTRTHPDFPALEVLDMLVSGSSTSRVERVLRERHGWTYQARSVMQSFEVAGRYQLLTEVETPQTAPAIRAALEEIGSVLTRGFTDRELEDAKRAVIQRMPAEFFASSGVATRVAALWLERLPTDYYAEYGPRVAAVTRADVVRVARRYLAPPRLHVAVAGDLAAIEASVRALRLGTVEIVSPEMLIPPMR